eukprot:CAMPEP_0180793554 /NCGR_PEP_ID=MMETSP1038_2-20121128/55065_1 /TAXON_ID=632150 /ORGANISM="Azadinium spinosum, Strain 3D9" /LENGTH=40 /DNA_ID= /DNA_START= /DNA_END= /DNA_ORIENTATION=
MWANVILIWHSKLAKNLQQHARVALGVALLVVALLEATLL